MPSNDRNTAPPPSTVISVLFTKRPRPKVYPVPSPPERATLNVSCLTSTLPTNSESSRAQPAR